MEKKKAKNTGLIIEALGYFIFEISNKDVDDIENNEKLQEVATGFNKLSKLKRLLDFYIINFWLATLACNEFYEHDDSQKICDEVENGIVESLSSFEQANNIYGQNGLTLKEFVKDEDELILFYREFPIGEETKVNSRVLLDILPTKRFFDYNSTLTMDPNFRWEAVVRHFGKHIFGKKVAEEPNYILGLGPMFAVMLASTFCKFMEYIVEVEKQIDKK